jgi:hypothetical protein
MNIFEIFEQAEKAHEEEEEEKEDGLQEHSLLHHPSSTVTAIGNPPALGAMDRLEGDGDWLPAINRARILGVSYEEDHQYDLQTLAEASPYALQDGWNIAAQNKGPQFVGADARQLETLQQVGQRERDQERRDIRSF